MKAFTYSQKKWVLASALLAVLGLNVSGHINGTMYTADFSSEDVVKSKIPTADGLVPVKYIKVSDKKIIGLYYADTEGRICESESCSPREVTLQGDLKKIEDIDKLNTALLKAVAAELPVPRAPHAQEDSEVVESAFVDRDSLPTEEDKRAESLEKKLAALVKRCDRDKERAERLECYSSELTRFMADAAKKDVPAKIVKAVQKITQAKVLGLVKSEIHKSREARVLEMKARNGDWEASQTIMMDPYANQEAKAAQENAMISLSALIESVPKSFEPVRSLAMAAQGALIRDEAVEIQAQSRMADQYKNSNLTLSTQMKFENLARTEDLRTLQQSLRVMNNQALSNAVYADELSPKQKNQYLTHFQNTTLPIVEGIIMNPTTFQIPAGDGTVITPAPGGDGSSPDLSGRINNSYRGPGIPVTNPQVPNAAAPQTLNGRVRGP